MKKKKLKLWNYQKNKKTLKNRELKIKVPEELAGSKEWAKNEKNSQYQRFQVMALHRRMNL